METVNEGSGGKLTKRQRRLLKKEKRAEDMVRMKNRRRNYKFFIIGFIIIFILVLVYIYNNSQSEDIDSNQYILSNPYKGFEDAPVLIEEYSDFSCTACKAVLPIVDSLLEEYRDNIRLVFNYFPLDESEESNSFKAAEAANCAQELDKFWEYHDLLFSRQDEWSNATNTKDMFFEYASDLGLDEIVFSSCLEERKFKDKVINDRLEAKSRKVNSTPTFFINGVRKVGGQQLDNSRDLIEELINNQ